MEEIIRIFLQDKRWVPGQPEVRFLAAGEYNQNYLVTSRGQRWVFRVNRGSQLGLEDQIGYEFAVLRCVADSGVTPRPLHVHKDLVPFGGGAMLMEYLPGRPLVYERDWQRAAEIFARVHAVPVCDGLIVQKDPMAAIAKESLTLIHRYPDHPLTSHKNKLLQYHSRIIKQARSLSSLFTRDRLCVVNTEVNSGNFLITAKTAYLVDWEKGVVSSRYQDLAHFLAPTTTLWKTDTVFTQEEKKRFLTVYSDHLQPPLCLEHTETLCRAMEQTVILRGLSWCYMAWYEYVHGERLLTNEVTRQKIQLYMDSIDTLIPPEE